MLFVEVISYPFLKTQPLGIAGNYKQSGSDEATASTRSRRRSRSLGDDNSLNCLEQLWSNLSRARN